MARHEQTTDDLDVLDLDDARRSDELREVLDAPRRPRRKTDDQPVAQGVEALLRQWSLSERNLSAGDELDLLRTATNLAVDEDTREQAITRLIRANARRVFQVINGLRANRESVDMDELFGAGLSGLTRAILGWDEARASSARDMGTARFATTARNWIRKMAMEEFRRQVAPDLSERDFFLVYRIKQIKANFAVQHPGVEMTVEQVTAALRDWAIRLARKKLIEKEQKAKLGRVSAQEVERQMASWDRPDDFSERELRSRGAVPMEAVARLLSLGQSQRLLRLDEEVGEEGRTLGETIADHDNGASDITMEEDETVLLAGLSMAVGSREDDRIYRHGFRMRAVRGLSGRHVYEEPEIRDALGVEDDEMGMLTGESPQALNARRNRQAQKMGGLTPRPALLTDLSSVQLANGQHAPNLIDLIDRVGGRIVRSSDGSARMPCPGGVGAGDPARVSEIGFHCSCGCGSRGDAFDWWVKAQGLPPSSASIEREKYQRHLAKAASVASLENLVEDPARSEVIREALRRR